MCVCGCRCVTWISGVVGGGGGGVLTIQGTDIDDQGFVEL